MTTVLSILLSVTRGALLTAALIILVRLAFRRVLTAKAKYYLWLLLALRLMLPVVPESPVSLLNFLPERTSVQVQSAPVAPRGPGDPDAVLWEGDPETPMLLLPQTCRACPMWWRSSQRHRKHLRFPKRPRHRAFPVQRSCFGFGSRAWGWCWRFMGLCTSSRRYI